MHPKSGIKIWLDDFRPAPVGWTRALNVEAAKILMLQGGVDDISLDYDLDSPECHKCQNRCGFIDQKPCQYNCKCHDNGNETGLDLVLWMARQKIWPIHRPVVHSMNPSGAKEIEKVINNYFE